MRERIFVSQKAYRKSQGRNKLWNAKSQRRKKLRNAIFILMGLAGLGVFIGVFIFEGIATVERAKSTVSLWWYVVGAALIIPPLIFSIWNIFWFQAMFAFLKKRGGRGENERLATRGIGWAERRGERGPKR